MAMKKIGFIIILLQILSMLFFLSAHFLISIYYYSLQPHVLIVMEICFYMALITQIITILLVIYHKS